MPFNSISKPNPYHEHWLKKEGHLADLPRGGHLPPLVVAEHKSKGSGDSLLSSREIITSSHDVLLQKCEKLP